MEKQSVKRDFFLIPDLRVGVNFVFADLRVGVNPPSLCVSA
jgi:hypothetical protein